MYVKALAILLLISGLSYGIWKLYDAGGEAREAEVRLEFAEKEGRRDKEILRLQAKIADQKKAAEDAINAERETWKKRIDKLKGMVTDCAPPAVLSELRD